MRANTLTIGLLLVLTAGQSSSNALSFLDGFLVGIEKDANSPDQCATDSQSLLSATDALISDIHAAITGNYLFTQLLQDAIDLSNDFDSFDSSCDFTELITALQALTTADGVAALVWRFVDNAKEVGDYVKVLQECKAEYRDCGAAAGHIFSIIVGYQI